MTIVFAHDHPLKVVAGKYYTAGGFSNAVTSRYTELFGDMVFILRASQTSQVPERYSEVSNPKVSVLGIAPSELAKIVPAAKRIAAAVRSADGVIARLPSRIGTLAVHYAKKFRKPYLVESVACPWDSYRSEGMAGKIVAPIMWALTRYATYDAPYCLYVTSSFLQRRYPCKGHTIGCSDAEISLAGDEAVNSRIKHIPQHGDTLILGTLARVDLGYKGQADVIRAIAELDPSRRSCFVYRLAGQGNAHRLADLAKQLGVQDNVVFNGPLTHEEVFAWLDDLDVYIQPSKQEGLPRSVIEAMGRGCPVIGSNAGGIPELLDSSCVFPIGDVHAITCMLGAATPQWRREEAKRNYAFAHQFESKTLSARRNGFYREFTQTIATRQ
ncbi:glycosyltransferase [Bifidobacterium biavatii]|uniref:Putative polysaccharide biosynthesis protein n=1 Tax=Bifidobacterium biavatii DSM 23969 TaxID=1437608 RepID=A0A086ZT00_9BIFI|nr:glycosyltransferase [Bifidobacterium biavatii]KFI49650.1 putative polysaccharide biosynthesis protein [Bifidobacterium biavatii DSM 23969]